MVVGHILTCDVHPDSDHMHICQVNIGSEEPVQIVCGAANVAANQKVIVATIGTKLYDGDKEFVIKRSKLRGVESFGMICAEDEIGVGTSHEGIMVLPDSTPVGMKAADYFNIQNDYIIEVDITPNRADACSHYGVARDLYAWLVRNGYETRLTSPSVENFAIDNQDLNIDIEVKQKEACPRYCAVTLKDCEVKASPDWLQKKLTTIGVRPINNIVDITNYIMFAFGQPLHCFDADMITGQKVIVQTMPTGTPFITLDGEEHKLDERDLAICNEEAPMCIAGVFGGRGSGTYENTKNVLIESAYFHPTWIRKSARRHGLSTDASFRFERGIHPDGQIYALKLAALMIKELAGGTISMNIKDIEAADLKKEFIVDVRYNYITELIGKEIEKEVIKSILTSLEIEIVEETEDELKLKVPGYRVDVQRPCDIVEEILRIYGYNNVEIPTSVKSSLTIKGEVDRSNKLENLIAEQLVGQGFHEILNNSLTKESYYNGLQQHHPDALVKLLNPLSTDLNVMRQTLLFGGLESISHNANRKMANLRFFEFGNCYFRNEAKRNPEKVLSAYSEDQHLGLWVTGKRVDGSWAHADEPSSVYELKGYVYGILKRLGVQLNGLLIGAGKNDIFSKSLEITDRNGKLYLELGLVKKSICSQLNIDNEVYFADLNWTNLMKNIKKNKVSYTEIGKFPSVSRDLALLVDKAVEFKSIEQIAYATEKKLLKKVELFDVYEGKNLEEGKKSYAVNFVLQDDSKTMNDKQTDAIMQKIIAQLEKQLGAKLR